jgi:alcohol dehydrogenase class IV
MPIGFEFATAGRIVFGAGKLAESGPVIAALAPQEKRALVVVGARPERAANLLALLEEAGFSVETFSVAGEPSIATAKAGAATAKAMQANLVIGFGGGSVLDAGKAIATLATNGDPLRYLEVVGEGKPLDNRPLPYVAIPTTAGTGSEATRNAVLSVPEHAIKVSLRHPLMLPTLAIVDPELTYGLPPALTASTGLDALTQLLEPFTCNAPNPITDALCREGLRLTGTALRTAYREESPTAREAMALASLFGGMALANARLGAVHGFAAPIGGMFNAPHGAVCAALLPAVSAMNIVNLRQRLANANTRTTLSRYDEAAQLITGEANANADQLVAWLYETCAILKIAPLASYGLSEADFALVAEKAARSNSMRGNPIALGPSDLHAILAWAL